MFSIDRKRKLSSSKRNNTESSDEELEDFLFGNTNFKTASKDEVISDINVQGETETLLPFSISTKPSHFDGEKLVEEDTEKKQEQQQDEVQLLDPFEKKAAWEDPDDDQIQVDLNEKKKFKRMRTNYQETSVSGKTFQKRLKERYERVLPAPAWADISNVEKEGDEDKLFNTASDLLEKSSSLPSGKIQLTRKLNLNKKQPDGLSITSLGFHPSAKIAFTASSGKRLTIFQADGEENKKLQSVFVRDFAITSAAFTDGGSKILMTGDKSRYIIFDLLAGNIIDVPGLRGKKGLNLDKFTISPDGSAVGFLGDHGYLHFASVESCQYMYSLKMNGTISAATYSKKSNQIYTTGGDGEVYIWDARNRKCLHRFIDDGSIGSTSIACSNNGKFLAVGSKSGVVNIYNNEGIENFKTPKPVKTMMNLKTEIDGTAFNSTSEILVTYTSHTKHAIKMLHFPSLSVFGSWPNQKDIIGYVNCVDFSPQSGYLGIGTTKGNALLYRLKHFPDA